MVSRNLKKTRTRPLNIPRGVNFSANLFQTQSACTSKADILTQMTFLFKLIYFFAIERIPIIAIDVTNRQQSQYLNIGNLY